MLRRTTIAFVGLALFSFADVQKADAAQGDQSAEETDTEETTEDDDALQISTDRPGAGDGASVVPKRHFQIESGVNAAFSSSATNVNLAHTLFRYGLASFAEARLIATPVGISSGTGTDTEAQPLSTVTLGAKFGTPLGSDAAVALLPYASLSHPTDDADWSAGATFASELGTSQNVSMGFNLGAASVPADDGRGVEIFASISGSGSITDAAGTFLEVYTVIPPASAPSNFVDTGLTYALGNRLQLDGWFGIEIAREGSRMVGIGASYLL